MLTNVHVHIHERGKDYSEAYENEALELLRNEKNWKTGRPWKKGDWCVDVETLIEDMDRAGVNRSWISGYHMKPLGAINEGLSEFLCGLRNRYPDRLIPMINADPLGGLKTVRAIEHAVKELGMRAVGEFLPAYNYVQMQDYRIYPIYEVCQELGLPILIHTGMSAVRGGKTFEFTHPSHLEHVLFDFPKLKLILAHSAGIWFKETLVVMMKYSQVYADTAWWPVFPFHWLADYLVWAKRMNCIDRVLWGTDYPYCDFAADIETLRRVPDYSKRHELEPHITEEDIDALLGLNAARLIPPK